MFGLSITPSFPKYSGPYSVGSCDVEIPASELSAPSPAPEGADVPSTVAFRVFYPCEPTINPRPIRWLPGPQKAHLSAYVKFAGANSFIADGVSFLPHLLYYTTIPAVRNAPLLAPKTSSGRWPTMVFSHGLGGSRNAYSHICGSLASYGIIVVAPDHRDRSAPVSFIRATKTTPAKTLTYNRYPHNPSPEVYAGRDQQLKIRLWELGLIHDALLRIDQDDAPTNLDPNSTNPRKKDVNDVLQMFVSHMDVHQPGSIIWAGHSFGACTTVQLLKSTYWGPVKGEKAVDNPLFNPAANSALAKQITPESPAILLDMWCLPLQSPETAELCAKPLPCYAADGPGGSGIVAVLSEAFAKWKANTSAQRMALTSNVPDDTRPGPKLFYPTTSAHLSQSDFGILFAWLIKRVLKTEQPAERYIKLNVRAILQTLRINGYEVADTSPADMDDEMADLASDAKKQETHKKRESRRERKRNAQGPALTRTVSETTTSTMLTSTSSSMSTKNSTARGDWKILESGLVNGWVAIDGDDGTGEAGTLASQVRSRSPASDLQAVETEVLGEVAG